MKSPKPAKSAKTSSSGKARPERNHPFGKAPSASPHAGQKLKGPRLPPQRHPRKPGSLDAQAQPGAQPRQRPARKISRISRLLSEAGLRLQKGLGQNFLVNQGALEKIADSIHATKESLVIEIGSGLGNLTEMLAHRAGKVVAIELDERFQSLHQRELRHLDNLIFLYADFMELSLRDLVTPFSEQDVRVIGNIPYHLTSPILFKLMASTVPVSKICLLMQREVGQRIVAAPGSKEYGILSIKTQSRFDAHMEFTISPGSFLPPPKVHSSLVSFTPRPQGPLITAIEEQQFFFHFVDAAFAQRRKLITKSLEAGSKGIVHRQDVESALERTGLPLTARAEELSVEHLLALFRALGSPHFPSLRKNYAEDIPAEE